MNNTSTATTATALPVIPVISIAFAAGIALARLTAPAPWLPAALAVAAAAAAIAARKIHHAAFIALIAAAVAASGAFLSVVDSAVSPSPRLMALLKQANADKRPIFFDAVVENSTLIDNNRAKYTVRIEKAGKSQGKMFDIHGLARLSIDADTTPLPRYADRLSFSARCSPLDFLDSGVKNHFKLRGIAGFLTVKDGGELRVTGRARKFPLFVFGHRLGEKLRGAVAATLPEPHSLVLNQMLFGKTVAIPEEIEKEFRDAGVIHVLVVSGMHVTILVGFFLSFGFIWKKNPWVSIVILGSALLVFLAISGGGPSVMRAVIMGFLLIFVLPMKRDYNIANSLFAAMLFILILGPGWLSDPGFQLSFLACAGMIFLFPAFFDTLPLFVRKNLRNVSFPFFVSICAQIPLYPVIAWYFNSVSFSSPLANLIVVPIASILLPAGLLYSFAVLLIPKSAVLLAPIMTFILKILLSVTSFFAQLPFSSISVAQPSFFFIAAFFASLLAWLLLFKTMKNGRDEAVSSWIIAAGASSCLLVWSWLFFPVQKDLRVTFIDVGEGDSILIDAPWDKNGGERFRILVDGGGNPLDSDFDPGEYNVRKALADNHVDQLDAIILTHPDADHMLGLLWVLRNYRVNAWIDPCVITGSYVVAENCYLRGSKKQNAKSPKKDVSAAYFSILDILKKRDIPTFSGLDGLSLSLNSGLGLRFLYPSPDDLSLSCKYLNDISSVFRLDYGKTSFLFPGDIGIYGESRVLARARYLLPADVLKVPHHGSSTSSSAFFVHSANPSFSIISVGRLNMFSHPHASPIRAYEKIHSRILRTDVHGDITLRSDGQTVFANTELSAPPPLFNAH